MDRQERYERYWAEVGDPEKRRKLERRYRDRKRVPHLPEVEMRQATQKDVGTKRDDSGTVVVRRIDKLGERNGQDS